MPSFLADDVTALQTSCDAAERKQCEQLLRPLFAAAAATLSSEDRLLIKLSVLDQAPQAELAKALHIHSGSVTRRRQRIARDIWSHFRCAAAASKKWELVQDCLQLVLTAEDPHLRRRLGDVLAQALEQA